MWHLFWITISCNIADRIILFCNNFSFCFSTCQQYVRVVLKTQVRRMNSIYNISFISVRAPLSLYYRKCGTLIIEYIRNIWNQSGINLKFWNITKIVFYSILKIFFSLTSRNLCIYVLVLNYCQNLSRLLLKLFLTSF